MRNLIGSYLGSDRSESIRSWQTTLASMLFAAMASLSLVSLSSPPAKAGDWRQFRGNKVDGIAEATDSGPDNVQKTAWKAELPGRGISGPIVVGEKVFVTASSGYHQDRLHVLCFDSKSGKRLWERQFLATGRTMCHPKMANATPNPASDGQRVFAFFSSNDLVCLDLEGNLLWFRGLTFDYPNASNSLGMASSPIVSGETLIVQVESDAESLAFGLDVKTGENRWKLDRPKASNWTSPTLLSNVKGSPPLALLQSGEGLEGVEVNSGRTVWKWKQSSNVIPSTVVAGGLIYVPSQGLTALRPVPGDSAPELLWSKSQLGPSTPSPLVVGEDVFIAKSSGVLVAGDAKTGSTRWQMRVKGPFTATPIAAGGKIYLVNEAGTVTVIRPGSRKGDTVSTVDLKETILCTPALSEKALYLRSDKTLWKLGE